MILTAIVQQCARSNDNGIRMLQSSQQTMMIEFAPRYLPPVKITEGGEELVRYDFEGSVSNDQAVAGEPEIRVLLIPLRLPTLEHNIVEIVQAEYEEIRNVILAPLPHWRTGDIDPISVYTKELQAYSVSAFLPQVSATLSHLRESHGTLRGDMLLAPLQYNPMTRTLRKYSKIVARVNFGAMEFHKVRRRQHENAIAINEDAFLDGTASRDPHGAQAMRNSVLGTGVWFRFPVTEEGMYKFSGQALLDAGVPSGTDPNTIKIFGNGGYETPMAVDVSYVDDLLENAVYVFDGGTVGKLDASDYVIFSAKGTRGWKYNPVTKTFSHYINHFTETNYYWLTYGNSPSKKMSPVTSLSASSPLRPTTITNKLFREDERVNMLSSGQEWLGQQFNNGDQLTYVHVLDGIDGTQPISYTFRVGARSSGFSTFTMYEHNLQLSSVVLQPTDLDSYDSYQFMNSIVSKQIVPTFTDGTSTLRFVFSSTSSSGIGYIDWYEIFYHQFQTAKNNVFHFHTLDTNAIAEFRVNGFTGSNILVFDVAKFDSASIIADPQISGDSCSFQLQLAAGNPEELYVVADGGYKTPSSLTLVPNQNLHGDTTQADYIIITHPDFMPAAQRLKQFREGPESGFLKTLVVDINQIYNEFGGGMPTPAAVRNYLRYVDSNWTAPPSYCLLFGDGDYDYRKIISKSPNWMPYWETVESFKPITTYASDDDYATFHLDTLRGGQIVSGPPEIGLGRLTARSLGEANTMVDKIIEYETSSVNDPWKIRVTFVADDGPQGVASDGRTLNDGLLHTKQAESLSGIVPPVFEKRKIYLYDYPTVFTPVGRRKPDVNVAIKNQINQGTLVLNFTGHGNPRVWTHEQVFVRETDFSGLANKGKYFFLVGATCNYSHCDMLNDQSGGELLAAMPNAGAIGVLSATRPVFAGDNYALNKTLYDSLFKSDNNGNIIPKRIGDVIYQTKQLHYGPGSLYNNDRKFFLLGDPALQVAFPRLLAAVDSINHHPTAQTAQLRALSKASFISSVRDDSLNLNTAYSGQSQMVIYDADRFVQLAPPDISETMDYKVAGNVLFRGEQNVVNGKVQADFVVPKDISYGNNNGRMTLYFWNSSEDGAGYTTNFIVGGFDSTAQTDLKGPQIKLFLDSRGFKSGDVVSGSPRVIADLFDSSGMNTSGAGIGHRIEAWLDNSSQSINMSDYYKSKLGTYQEGTVEYVLGSLSYGSHKLRMRAWDTYNNSSDTETVFDVVTSVGLQLTNVYNFPNPFPSNTVFTFQHNQLTPIDVEVKVYTVAGRLIQSLTKTNVTEPFVQIPWDGRDRDGDMIANGVYLYKIVAKTEDHRLTTETLGKLSVLK